MGEIRELLIELPYFLFFRKINYAVKKYMRDYDGKGLRDMVIVYENKIYMVTLDKVHIIV